MKSQLIKIIICIQLFILVSSAVPQDYNRWQSIGPYCGDVHVLVGCPTQKNLLFAGSIGGIYQSNDGGINWREINGNLPPVKIQTIAVNPLFRHELFIGTTENGIYKTLNGGSQWTSANAELSNFNVTALAIDDSSSSTLYAGTFGDGIFKSTNLGDFWVRSNNGLTSLYVTALLIDPANKQNIYAATTNGLFYSENQGQSWQPLISELAYTHLTALVLPPSSPNLLFISSYKKGIFRYYLSTQVYENISGSLPDSFVTALAFTPTSTPYLLAGTYHSGIFRQKLNSTEWQAANAGLNAREIRSILVDPHNPRVIFAGTFEGGIFRSEDQGASWYEINRGLALASVNGIVINPEQPHRILAGLKNGIFLSDETGKWHVKLSDMQINVLKLQTNPVTAFVAGTESHGIVRSEDFGESWSYLNSGLGATQRTIASLALTSGADYPAYLGTKNGYIYRFNEARANWENIAEGMNEEFYHIYALAADPAEPQRIFIGCSGGVYQKFGPNPWQAFNDNLPFNATVSELAIDPQQPTTIYCVIRGSGVYKSLHKGTDWFPINQGLPHSLLTALIIDPEHSQRLFIGTTYSGVFASFDGGEQWLAANDQLPNYSIQTLTLADSILYCGLSNGGIYQLALQPHLETELSQIDFGEVLVDSSAFKTLKLSNSGLRKLIISNLATNLSLFSVQPRQLAIPPKESKTIQIQFRPEYRGTEIGKLILTTNDPYQSVQNVFLVGKGVAPVIDFFNTTLIDFGPNIIHSRQDSSFVIYNQGDALLRISRIEFGNDRFTPVGPDSFAIEPSKTCKIQLRFSPDSVKLESGSMHIFSNDPEETRNPLKIRLQGRGILGSTSLTCDCEAINLGVVALNSYKDTTLTLINNSDHPLTLLNVRCSEPVLKTVGPTQYQLPIGTRRPITIRYQPEEVVSTSANITIIYECFDKDTLHIKASGQVAFPANTFQLAISGGSARNAFRMFSLPAYLAEPNLFNLIQPQLGDYDVKKWRIFRWEAAHYAELNDDLNPNLAPGKAFWIITKADQQLDYGAGHTVPIDQPFRIPLAPGWNQIGNPFPFPVDWQEIVQSTGHSELLDTLYWYNGEYIMTDTFAPFTGYWVKNRDPLTTISLAIPPIKMAAVARPLVPWPTAEWWLRLAVESAGAKDNHNFVGVAATALHEWDRLDHSEPPPIGDYVALYFDHPDWPHFPGTYTSDFRAASQTGWVWDFTIETNIRNQNVELNVDNLNQLSADYEIFLFDRTAKAAHNLRHRPNYVFLSASSEKSLRLFRLIVGSKAFLNENQRDIPLLPCAFHLSQNYPNPLFMSRPSPNNLSCTQTTIRFDLPAATRVSITVYDLMGREVHPLIANQMHPGGSYFIHWDGRDQQGNFLASGIYFYALKAGAFQAVRKLVIAR